jgi:hypothetical protein
LHSRLKLVSIVATAKQRLRQLHGDRFQRTIFNLSRWKQEVNPKARLAVLSASEPLDAPKDARGSSMHLKPLSMGIKISA